MSVANNATVGEYDLLRVWLECEKCQAVPVFAFGTGIWESVKCAVHAQPKGDTGMTYYYYKPRGPHPVSWTEPGRLGEEPSRLCPCFTRPSCDL